jgi:hypothetical protein
MDTRDSEGNVLKRYSTELTVLVSAAGIILTFIVSILQQRSDAHQNDLTTRQNQYADIVDGLASDSLGIQVSSMRRLVQFVGNGDNFEDDADQVTTAVNTAQTLSSFITDESIVAGREGVGDYRDPQPVVVSRAVGQLIDLMTHAKGEPASEKAFPEVNVDLSRGDFHGVPVRDVRPRGTFWAVGADFRRAGASGWHLERSPSANLSDAFFTCADLQTSNLGHANVEGADFTGANLRGADLSGVVGLTDAQLTGAVVGEATRLPDGVSRPVQPGWWVEEDGVWTATSTCRGLVDRMTQLLPGSGYRDRLPCPGAASSPWPVRLTAPAHRALDRVCRLRAWLATRVGEEEPPPPPHGWRPRLSG